jgi:thymidylate synthase (FAD)
MKLINQTFEILTPISENGLSELKHIERIARVCYKSEDLISEDGESAKRLISALIRNKHEAMLEHGSISVLITTNRGVSHELVRHRIASYAQESTRYCNYSKDKFNNELTFIYPWSLLDESRLNDLIIWERAMQNVENTYMQMINDGCNYCKLSGMA